MLIALLKVFCINEVHGSANKDIHCICHIVSTVDVKWMHIFCVNEQQKVYYNVTGS